MKKNVFRLHALKRMIERSVSKDEILDVIFHGEMIENYKNDQPFPSKLMFKVVSNRPIHVVFAESAEENIIITVYEPTLDRWENGFKIRRNL